MPDKVYTDKDFNKDFALTVADAMNLWAHQCAQEVARNGDHGTCVIGAGIGVWYKPARCRNERELRILDVPYTAGQGASTWESSVQQVINHLADKGIVAHYMTGRMD